MYSPLFLHDAHLRPSTPKSYFVSSIQCPMFAASIERAYMSSRLVQISCETRNFLIHLGIPHRRHCCTVTPNSPKSFTELATEHRSSCWRRKQRRLRRWRCCGQRMRSLGTSERHMSGQQHPLARRRGVGPRAQQRLSGS